jgi:hypothetical protein
MELAEINFLAVFAASMTSFLIGGLWYSPLMFGNIWMEENNFSRDDIKKRNIGKIFSLSFLITLLIGLLLAIFLGPEADFGMGIIKGGLVGSCWAASSIGIIYLFESRSLKLFLINGGYIITAFAVMGGIIGIWK